MVKPDKKNKREYERKKKAEEPKNNPEIERRRKQTDLSRIRPEKPDQTSEPKPAGSEIIDPVDSLPSNFTGVREDGKKLVTEANQRFMAARTDIEEENRWKRNISSNWTRYEVESEEDEEEDGLTGQDWNFALNSGNRAESHIRLKGEQDWDTAGSTELSKEFFSLDLTSLDSLIKCIPLHQQIGLDQNLLDQDTFDTFKRKAQESVKPADFDPILRILKEPKSSDILVPNPTKSVNTDIKTSSASPVDKQTDSAPPVDKQTGSTPPVDKQTGSTPSLVYNQTEEPSPDKKVAATVIPEPLEQRRKRDKKPVKPEVPDPDQDQADLDFLASLDKPSKLEPGADEMNSNPAPGVVPVSILKVEESKGLEDWLDDFLGD